jgi:hypothetical protein
LSYEWQRNGKQIPEAKKPTLAFSAVKAGENGDIITAIVRNSEGEAVSDDVALTVTPKSTQSKRRNGSRVTSGS